MRGPWHLCGIALAATASIAGCGDGGGATGPSGPDFAELDDSVNAFYCIRGNTTVGRTESGSVAATDCDLDMGAYWETWRVGMRKSAPVTPGWTPRPSTP